MLRMRGFLVAWMIEVHEGFLRIFAIFCLVSFDFFWELEMRKVSDRVAELKHAGR